MKTSIHSLLFLVGNVQCLAFIRQLTNLLVLHPISLELGKGVQLASLLPCPSHLLLGLLESRFLLGRLWREGNISFCWWILARGMLLIRISVFEWFSIWWSADCFFFVTNCVPRLFYSSDDSSRICSSLIICYNSWSLEPPSIWNQSLIINSNA